MNEHYRLSTRGGERVYGDRVADVLYHRRQIKEHKGSYMEFFGEAVGQEREDKSVVTPADTNLSCPNQLAAKGTLFLVERIDVSGVPAQYADLVTVSLRVDQKRYESLPLDLLRQITVSRIIDYLRAFTVTLECYDQEFWRDQTLRAELHGFRYRAEI